MRKIVLWSKVGYNKMLETGKVQISPQGNTTFVSNPASIDSFKGATNGSIYVEFEVNTSRLIQAGNTGWSRIDGPESLTDRFNALHGLDRIIDMPDAANIKWITSK